MNQGLKQQQNNTEEKPPFFKTWKTWYISLLIYLAALISLFYLFTKTFE